MKHLIISSLFIIILTACGAEESNNDDLFQYKDSFVGDNSAVGNTVNQLPNADDLRLIELKTDEEPYGVSLTYNEAPSDQVLHETILYNATFLFTLIQNVEWITFQFHDREYTLTKENLQDWYKEDLSKIQNADELRNLINDYLKDEIKMKQLLKQAV